MIRKVSLLLIIISLYSTAFGQSTKILRQSVEKQAVIKKADTQLDNYNNAIMDIVSRTTNDNPDDELLYTYKEHRSIYKNTNKLNLKIAIGNFVFLNQVSYQGFSINSFLIPDLVSYKVIWKDTTGNVLKTALGDNERFVNGKDVFKENLTDVYDFSTYELYLEYVGFGFSKKALTKLDAFISKVDDYYNADARLNLINQSLNKIRTDTLELLENFYQQTIDNTKIFNQIKSQRYASKLDLDANDPVQFRSHLGQSEVRNRDIKKQLEQILHNMHIAYYKKGLDWLQWNDEAKAIGFFNQSITQKNNYAPPYLQLAKIDYKKGNYQGAIDTCAKIIASYNPDNDTRYEAIQLSEKVIYTWIDEINGLLAKADYNHAVEKFELAENYANKIQGVKRFAEFETIRGGLFQAAYAGLINTAKTQIHSQKLVCAQNTIDSATVFRILHKTYVMDNKSEISVLNLLYEGWINRARQYLNGQKADSALYAATQAKIICKKYSAVNCTDELTLLMKEAVQANYKLMIYQAYVAVQNQWTDTALSLLNRADKFRYTYQLNADEQYDGLLIQANQLKYDDLIALGDQAFKSNDNLEALNYYDEAAAIENTYSIRKQMQLPEKIVNAATQHIIKLCIEGESYAEALKLDAAKKSYRSAQSMANAYKLNEHEKINEHLKALAQQLIAGRCDEADYNYNIQIRAAKKFIEQKDFVLASQALTKAKSVAKLNPNCGLNNQVRKKIENDIRAMLKYQKQMKQIDQLIEAKEYADVIDKYAQITKFYNDSCSQNFGISHNPLYVYLKNNKTNQLIDYSVRYYTEIGKADSALNMLTELEQRNYNASWSKESQEQLGIYLAEKDYAENPDLDPKTKVLEYTAYNKWFKYLKKAYISAWKRFF